MFGGPKSHRLFDDERRIMTAGGPCYWCRFGGSIALIVALALLLLFTAGCSTPVERKAEQAPVRSIADDVDGSDWRLVVQYIHDPSGVVIGRTIGFGFSTQAECERKLAEIISSAPEGILPRGACVTNVPAGPGERET
jgi:hypothetical protein